MKKDILKLTWKHRVIYAVATGVLFVLILYLFDLIFWKGQNYTTNALIFQGVFFGIFFGLGFPYLMGTYGDKLGNKLSKNVKPELSQGEVIDYEGLANLFKGVESVGGKLFLTNKKLIFKSHSLNIQKGQTDIPYAIISDFYRRKTAKIVDNGIRIKTNDNQSHDFVVNNREKWIEQLKLKTNIS